MCVCVCVHACILCADIKLVAIVPAYAVAFYVCSQEFNGGKYYPKLTCSF